MTPSERAAALSARIHREINAGRFVLGLPTDHPECETSYCFLVDDADPAGACTGCALGAAAFALDNQGALKGVFTVTINALGAEASHDIENGFEGLGFFEDDEIDEDSPFFRLGAELRAIAIGNRAREAK